MTASPVAASVPGSEGAAPSPSTAARAVPGLATGAGPLLMPSPGGRIDRFSTGIAGRSPMAVVVALVVALLGAAYAVLVAVLVGLGLVVTKVLDDGPVGRWESRVNTSLAAHRTARLDQLSAIGSNLAATLTVVAVASVLVVVLIAARRWPAALLLGTALLLEVTVFVSATLLVERSRPDVVRLDASPPTSSFPSGHTAAAVALYCGLALVVCTLTVRVLPRVAAWMVGVAVPIAVAWSRLYRGMHHPTDVLAAALLGTLSLLAAVLIVRTTVAVVRRRRRDHVVAGPPEQAGHETSRTPASGSAI